MTQWFSRQVKAPQVLNPRAMLFGLCVLNFLVSLMYVRRVELEAKAAIAAGYWGYSEHWDPVAVMWEPFLLLVAVIGLLINRWWSLGLSLFASARIIYLLVFLSWRTIPNSHDVPMFSWQAIAKLWAVIYQPRPQYLIEVILAFAIFVYAIELMRRYVHARTRVQTTGG